MDVMEIDVETIFWGVGAANVSAGATVIVTAIAATAAYVGPQTAVAVTMSAGLLTAAAAAMSAGLLPAAPIPAHVGAAHPVAPTPVIAIATAIATTARHTGKGSVTVLTKDTRMAVMPAAEAVSLSHWPARLLTSSAPADAKALLLAILVIKNNTMLNKPNRPCLIAGPVWFRTI